MIKPHWNITYVYNRLVLFFYEKFNPKHPWITKGAIEYFKENVSPDSIMIEFGSGRSTVYYAKHVRKIMSIEHNLKWYNLVNKRIKNLSNVELHHLEDENYENILNNYNDNYFDIIVNDGIRREKVAMNSIVKLKPGGFMILDNSERYIKNNSIAPAGIQGNNNSNRMWIRFAKQTENWETNTFSNGVSDTTILIKPATS